MQDYESKIKLTVHKCFHSWLRDVSFLLTLLSQFLNTLVEEILEHLPKYEMFKIKLASFQWQAISDIRQSVSQCIFKYT